jgi:hypothetical protein
MLVICCSSDVRKGQNYCWLVIVERKWEWEGMKYGRVLAGTVARWAIVGSSARNQKGTSMRRRKVVAVAAVEMATRTRSPRVLRTP